MFNAKIDRVLHFIESFLLAVAFAYGAAKVDNFGYLDISLVMTVLSFVYGFIATYYFVNIFRKDEEE